MLEKHIQTLKDAINVSENLLKNDKLIAHDFSLHESITSMKLKINEIVEAINSGELKGEDGAPGIDGVNGQDGKDFKYEDFTTEQLEQLRGPQGYRGEKGEQGIQGIQGIQGAPGKDFKYEDFTAEQLENLRGPVGPVGPEGPQGQNGIDGKNVELQRTNTHIQWRQEGQEEWNDLIEIEELRAPAVMNIDAYTKEETDALIADAITKALEDIGVILDEYATKQYVDSEIAKLVEELNAVGEIGENGPPAEYATEPTDAYHENMLRDKIRFKNPVTGRNAVLFVSTSMSASYPYVKKASNGKWTFYLGGSSSRRVYEYKNDAWVLNSSTTEVPTSLTYPEGEKPSFYSSTMDIPDTTNGNNNAPIYFEKQDEMNFDIVTNYNMAIEKRFYNIKHAVRIENAPTANVEGYLENTKIGRDIVQKVIDTRTNATYTRTKTSNVWGAWTGAIHSYEYTNADGMLESYSWIENNGIKTMWIDVKLSDAEYNLGSGGLLMKTLQIPEQAQVFNRIISATVNSYCREGENTLSRVIQNAEIISTTSVRARWKNTENTYPRIDRFTMTVVGI